jgi:hypothetical protein
VKRKMSGYPLRPRERAKIMRLHVEIHIVVIK